MCDIDKLHDKILTSINDSISKQTNDIKAYINAEINSLKEKIDLEKEKRTELEQKYEVLKRKYNTLEKGRRKNNVIVFGIENRENLNILEQTLDTLNKHLEFNIVCSDINNIYEIGKQRQNKPIVIEFVTFLKKVEVLKNFHKLKQTKISVSEVLSPEERRENKILRQHLQEAREKNLNAYIKKRKLYINQREYTLEQLIKKNQEAEEDIELEDITEEKTSTAQNAPNQENRDGSEELKETAVRPEEKKYKTRGNNASGTIPKNTVRKIEKDAKHTKFLRNQEN